MAKFQVTLTQDERDELQSMVKTGKAAARKMNHARILLLADEGEFAAGKTDVRLCLDTRFKKPGFLKKPGFCALQCVELAF